MIAGVSKAVTLYLAPILTLTALLLSLFAFLAPVVLLRDKVSLLSVTPSASLTQPGSSSSGVDGPTIFMGALGSCSRSHNADPLTCTSPSLSPTFDLSVLPSGAPDLLSAPTATTPTFIAISLGFSILFFIIFTSISFRAKLGARLGAFLDKPVIVRAVAWVGLLGFMIGITSFLVIRMWFGKAVDDFNSQIAQMGSQAPQLIASIDNGFTMVWVAYAFLAVPLVCALARLHVTAATK